LDQNRLDLAVERWIAEPRPEAVVRLRVDGRITTWSRMKDGKDGRPASGLRPCDEQTRTMWRQLYGERRGELVSIEEA
jgi:hypothetical protein